MFAYKNWFLEQLGMYAAYHQDCKNQLTHHIGVPIIVFSLLLALARIPLGEAGGTSVSAATIVLAILMLAYIVAVPLVGVATLLFYAVVYFFVVQIAAFDPLFVWTIAGVCFVGGWSIQFLGHVFEGRRPALTVNVMQVFLAPPYLVAKILFAFGMSRSIERDVTARAQKYLPKSHAA